LRNLLFFLVAGYARVVKVNSRYATIQRSRILILEKYDFLAFELFAVRGFPWL
jgi:hypothetical protein